MENCNKLLMIRGLDLKLLEVLNVSGCVAMKDLGDLSSLNKLRESRLCNWQSLVVIPGLKRLVSLEVLHVIGCQKMEELPDFSMPKKLIELKLTGCKSLMGIRGLGNLVSLEVLDLS